MKLFLLIYALGQVGGFAGPLPYGMDECLSNAAGMTAERDAALVAGINHTTGHPLTDEERRGAESLSFACEWRVVAPTLGESQ